MILNCRWRSDCVLIEFGGGLSDKHVEEAQNLPVYFSYFQTADDKQTKNQFSALFINHFLKALLREKLWLPHNFDRWTIAKSLSQYGALLMQLLIQCGGYWLSTNGFQILTTYSIHYPFNPHEKIIEFYNSWLN